MREKIRHISEVKSGGSGKDTVSIEQKETNIEFEKAKQELLDFLDTPHSKFKKEYNPVHPFEALKVADQKITKIISSTADNNEKANFLYKLFISDKMPNVFVQKTQDIYRDSEEHADYANEEIFGYEDVTPEDYETMLREHSAGEHYSESLYSHTPRFRNDYPERAVFNPDVFNYYMYHGFDIYMPERDITYTDYYYPVIVNRLAELGESGRNRIVDILKNILVNDKETSDLSDYKKRLFRDWDFEDALDIIGQEGEHEYESDELYKNSRIINKSLELLSGMPADSDTIKCLSQNFTKSVHSYAHNYSVVEEIFNKSPNESAGYLLLELKHEKDPILKQLLAHALHRLEFGRIGISEEGVKYLEKIYDLGEYNNPDFHVSRLTADGEVGVFNQEKELIKHFQLGDLSSPEKKVRAKVMDFVYETLFIPKENESEEEKEKRLRYLDEFKKHYYEITENEMFKNTGVRLNNLSFQEQGWFVVYFNEEKDPAKKQELADFIKKYGENGLRAFFSMEFGGEEMGGHILSLGRDLPKEAAEAVFYKYGELVATARKAAEYMAENLPKESADRIAINLLKHAKDLLANYSGDVVRKKEAGEETKTWDIGKQLNAIRADIMLFAAVFKESGLPLEAMQEASLSTVNAENLTEESKDRLRQLAKLNYAGSEFGDKVVLSALEKGMDNPADRFYLLKNKDEIVGTFRIEDQPDKYYFGSFNMDPNAQASGLGNAMVEKVVGDLAKVKPVEANVETDKPIASYYINKLGFAVTEFLPNVAGTGVDGFIIVKDNAKRENTGEFNYKNEGALIADIKKHLANGEFVVGYVLDKEKDIYRAAYGRKVEEERMAEAA